MTFCQIFPASFVNQFVLNKIPIVCLDGVRPANNFTPVSCTLLPGNGPAQLCGLPTTKSTFASIKNKQIFEEELKISEKVFGKLTLGKSKFAESEIWHFDGSDKV
jgi:hypothetical protein